MATRKGPNIWPKLLADVRRAVADGARTYADIYAAVPTNRAAIRRAVGELVRRGELFVVGGTRPVRIVPTGHPGPDREAAA